MNARLTIKVIQQGQAQKTHPIAPGAGQNGKALVLQAAKGTRYQITDALTFASPEKLQVKRVGQDLLIALQGNDVGTPDIVISGYFDVEDVSLTGLSPSGVPMIYDSNTKLLDKVKANGPTPISTASVLPDQTLSVGLASGPDGWFDSPWGLAAIGGGLALVAGASGGSGGSGGGAAATGLDKITAYKADQTKSLPTVTDFANAGVTGVDSTNLTGIISLLGRTQLPLTSAASVQALVDSFNKVLAEANGSTADATPSSDPSATDYVNLMGANTPGSVSRKPSALSLLNDRLKSLTITEADSYSEVKALADAVEALSTLAESSPSTSGTAATTGNLGAAQLTSLGVDVSATNLGAVSDAVRQAPDDLSTLGTVAKLTALVKAYNTILAEANGASADTTTANPTAADYAAIHASIGSAATDADALARLNAVVSSLASTSVDTVAEINKIAATLDKVQTVAGLATGATLTDDQKFSAEELKALGLNGFTGTEIQNAALALKVSEVIRDRTVAEVQTGLNTGWKLNANSERVQADQTQLERLQTLVSEQLIRGYSIDPTSKTSPYMAPTASDWQAIGVFRPLADGSTGKYQTVSGTDASALNDAIDTLVDNSTATTADDALIDTLAELQAVAASYLSILNEANGTASNFASDGTTDLHPDPAWSDYTAIGVTRQSGTPSDATLAKLVNSLVGEKSSTQVDTIKKLQTLVDTSQKLLRIAGGAADSLTFEELSNSTTGLGLSGIVSGTSGNVTAINTALRGIGDAQVDTIPELQSLVSLTRIREYSRDPNGEAPSFSDWSSLKMGENNQGQIQDLSGETNDNLAAYNSAAKALGQAAINETSLQAAVNSYNAILAEANGATPDKTPASDPNSTDYQSIGLNLSALWQSGQLAGKTQNGVDFINEAIDRLSTSAIDNVSNLSSVALKVESLWELAGKTVSTNGLVPVPKQDGTAPDNFFNDLGLTLDDLSGLGFNTSKLTNGTSDTNDINNVWAAIQNEDLTSTALTYAKVQLLIDAYAR